MDEILDLVNEKDEVIGQKTRSEIYAENLSNFRVVNLFLINSKGEIWIPRRTANKRAFPSCLDMSMGGHVESGETYEETLWRELKEELNLDADKENVRELGHLTPQKNGVSAFMKVYEIKTDRTPDYNKEDFTEAFWMKPEELLRKLESGEDKGKGDLPKLVRIFFSSDKKPNQ